MANHESVMQGYAEVGALFPFKELASASAGKLSAIDSMRKVTVDRADSLGMNAPQKSTCLRMLDACDHRDPQTGYHKAHFKALDFALAQQGDLKKSPAFYLGADISNLRGMNLALSGQDILGSGSEITPEGHELTNKVLKVMAGIMQDEVEKITGGRDDASAILYREGGDELSAIITGVDQTQMIRLQERINTRINTVMESAGLDRIAHPKYPAPEDKRAGASIASAFRPIEPTSDLQELSVAVDKEVHDVKAAAAADMPASKPIVNRLTRAEITHAANVLAALEPSIPQKEEGKGDYPFNHRVALQNKEDFLWPALRRQMQLSAEIKGRKFSEEGGKFLEGLHAIFEADDPITGAQRKSAMGAMQDGLYFLRHDLPKDSPTPPMHTLIFEMQNFAGLNDTYGHDECNKLFGQFAEKVNFNTEDIHIFRPDGRGNRLYVVTKGLTDEEITSHVARIVDEVDTLAQVKEVAGLENPRYPEREHNGVRFIIGAVRLEANGPHANPDVILSELDNQIVKNRQNTVCFDAKEAFGDEQGLALPYNPHITAANKKLYEPTKAPRGAAPSGP